MSEVPAPGMAPLFWGCGRSGDFSAIRLSLRLKQGAARVWPLL